MKVCSRANAYGKILEVVDEYLNNFRQYACIINCRTLPCLCKKKDPVKEYICYKRYGLS